MAATDKAVDLWLSAVDPVVQQWADETGSQDYMSLFTPTSPEWSVVSAGTKVWMITTQFVMGASDAELSAVISYLNSHDIELGLAGLMLPYGTDDIGSGVEGYSTPGTMSEVAQRIADFGGTLSVLEMDEPLFFGHQYEGTNAEQASIQEVADEVAVNVAAVEAVFPNVQIGDAEPVPTTNDISTWLTDYKNATGQSLSFVDADVQWGTDWLPGLEALSAYLGTTGTTLGVIFNGDATATSASEWEDEALQRISAVLSDPLISIQHAFVETWDPEPTYLLPEDTFGTLTNLALAYLTIAPILISSSSAQPENDSTMLTSPSGAWDIPGVPITLSLLGIGLSGSQADGSEYLIVFTSDGGTFEASTSGSDSVSGSGTSFLTISGYIQDVSASLTTATFVEDASDSPHIEILTANSNGSYDVTDLSVENGADDSPPDQSPPGNVAQSVLEVNVAALYEQVYNRDPDPSGLSSAVNSLLQGTASLESLRKTMATSAESISNITLAYMGVFDRPPTNDELVAAEDALSSGVPLFSIEAPWEAAAESAITWLYQSVLGRQPDSGGLASFSEAMLNGTGVQQAREIIATSAEASGDISTLVQKCLGITPTPSELSDLEQWLVDGLSLQQLTAVISNLPSTIAFQSISDFTAVPQVTNPSILIATATSQEMIAPITPGDAEVDTADQPTIVFLIGGGSYTIGGSSTSSVDDGVTDQTVPTYIDLPDGGVLPLSMPMIYTIPSYSDFSNAMEIQLSTALADTTVVNVATDMSTTLDITGKALTPIVLNAADTGLTVELSEPGDIVLSNLITNDVLGATPIAFLGVNYPDRYDLGLTSLLAVGSGSGELLRDTSVNLNEDFIVMPSIGLTINVTDFNPSTTSASFQYQAHVSEVGIEDGSRFSMVFLAGAQSSTRVHISADPSGGADVILASASQ